MLPQDDTKSMTETSAATTNQGEEQTVVKTGNKPFIEPTISVSLNILDATAFFQGSAGIDAADL
jgi:hypothetical protein